MYIKQLKMRLGHISFKYNDNIIINHKDFIIYNPKRKQNGSCSELKYNGKQLL
jgi:hypothetical protein